jgi:YjbE family integral membrane protein
LSMTLEYMGSILKIILCNLVLSGDNALVIGLAAHRLPSPQRRKAMIWGCGMACLMRVALTLVVARLLLFPGLKFVGAVLLAWIACKLVLEEDQSTSCTKPPPCSLWKAITRIAMADFIMSLDNVVAIAGVSDSDPVRIILGLLLSISMILLLSALIMEIMVRYRWIAYLGAAVLAWTAAEMMLHDLEFFYKARNPPQPELRLPRWEEWSIRLGLLWLCMTTKWWWPGPRENAAARSERLSLSTLQRMLK